MKNYLISATGKIHVNGGGSLLPWCAASAQKRKNCRVVSFKSLELVPESRFCRKCFPQGKPIELLGFSS